MYSNCAYTDFTPVILKPLLTVVSLKEGVGPSENHSASPVCPPMCPAESDSSEIKEGRKENSSLRMKHKLKPCPIGVKCGSPVRELHFFPRKTLSFTSDTVLAQ